MKKSISFFRAFRSDRRGNFAIIFALALVPLLGAVGAALDYARAAMLRTDLRAALDAAVLDVAQNMTGLSGTAISQAVQQKLKARFDVNQLSSFNLSVSTGAGSLSASATGDVPATIIEVLKISKVTIDASSTASWGGQSLEIALVLDNTGSMADVLGSTSKIQALTTAAKSFVSYMQTNIPATSSVKIAVVPFDTDVNVGTANLSAWWVDTQDIGNLTQWLTTLVTLCGNWGFGTNFLACAPHLNPLPIFSNGAWQGCVWERAQPNDVSNTAPAAGVSATLYQPDPMRVQSCGLAPMQSLTNSWTALNSALDQMKASGSTDLTIGLAWGFNMLTPNAPFPGAASFGTGNVIKAIVFMTDGWNTQSPWSLTQSQIDARTTQVCNNIKSAGIQIYAVATADADTALLQGCASSASTYFTITDGNQMGPVFQNIATQISKLRISQ